MKSEQRKERRQLRKKLAAAVKRHHFSLHAKVNMTPAQLKANTRKLVDQLLAGKNPYDVQPLS